MGRTSRKALRFGVLLLAPALFAPAGGCGDREERTDAEALILEGWNSYRLSDYKKALSSFSAAEKAAGTRSDLLLKALHGRAVTLDLRQPVATQDDRQAAELYRRIITADPDHDLAAWSALALARMTHLVPVGQEPDYDAVRRAYQDVIDAYPAHPAGQEALIYQQSTLIQSLEEAPTREAVDRLRRFIAEQPEARFISAAYDLLSNAYETLGEVENQLEAQLRELETMEIDPVSPQSSDLSHRYWKIATTAEFMTGDFDTARIYYRKLIEEYPLDFRKFGARQALKRMDEVEQAVREQAR